MKPVLGTLNMPDDYSLSKTDFLTGGYKALLFYRILPIEEDNPVSLTVKDEPASAELKQLVHTIAHRVGRYLERQGWLERDAENDYLALDAADDDPLSVLQGHSISYRIALGPQAGRKVFSLQTPPPVDMDEMHSATVGQVAGFNLHAGVAARGDQRHKLERLPIYHPTRGFGTTPITDRARQGALSAENPVSLRNNPCHVTPRILPLALRVSLRLFKIAPGDFVEPLDFISRLAALVPRPRVNLTRYHGVFAPDSQHRALVTPARRGRGSEAKASRPEDATPVASHAAMNWAQRLKRVFDIDIETCRVCGGAVKVIAAIEDPEVIKKILTHLRAKGLYPEAADLPHSRAPLQRDLFS